MTVLFISHSGEDRAEAEMVKERLRAEGVHSIFLDFDPEDGIPAGQNWEQMIYSQIRKADALLALGSPSADSSYWCFAEIALAKLLNKPIIPMTIRRPHVRHPLLHDRQEIDYLNDPATAFVSLWAGLRDFGLDPRGAFDWDPRRQPYPGLSAFTAEDAAVFFGRDIEIERLREILNPTLYDRGQFVAVVGPSGSGKSSLVRAGLLPRIARIPQWQVVPPFIPGNEPLRNLSRSLCHAFEAVGIRVTPQHMNSRLREGGSALATLVDELRDAANSDNMSVLFVVDQAEELLTEAAKRERERDLIISLIREAVRHQKHTWVVAALRAEFLGTFLQLPESTTLVDETFAIGPLAPASHVRDSRGPRI